MEKFEISNMWYYFLDLEKDLSNSSRYIEPKGQENVYSFEFSKLLILACTEVESAFKAICKEIEGKEPEGNIGEYKRIILKHFPDITSKEVIVSRLEKNIKPFEKWKNGKLFWWDAYQEIKHSRGLHFDCATYKNALYSISALYILVLYLHVIKKIQKPFHYEGYISSRYEPELLLFSGSNLED